MTRFVLKDTEYYIETLPGFLSTGGGGHATRQINGVWQTVADGVPLIGDGGLGVWAARSQNFGNPAFSDWPDGGPPAQVTATMPARYAKVAGISGPNALKIIGPFSNDAGRINCLVGAIGSGLRTLQMRVRVVRRGAGVATLAAAVDPISALVFSFNLNAAPLNEWVIVQAEATFSSPSGTVVGLHTSNSNADFEIDWLNFKVGASINDPPVLQDTGLPATRTAGGISVPQAPDTTQGTVIVEGTWPLVLTPNAIFAEPAQLGSANLSGFTIGGNGTGDAPRVIFRAGSDRIDCNAAAPISPGSAFRMGLSWGLGAPVASAQGVTLASTATPAQLDFNPAHQLSLGSRAGGQSLWTNSGLIRRVTWDMYSVDQAALNARTAL